MVRHHVSQRAGAFVIGGSPFDTYRFGHCDLHEVNERPIPKWLDDGVRKAKDSKVLHCIFTSKVVDAINLIFAKTFLKVYVQCHRRGKVVPKRLFNNQTAPSTVFFSQQAHAGELRGNFRNEGWRYGEIKKPIPPDLALLFNCLNSAL